MQRTKISTLLVIAVSIALVGWVIIYALEGQGVYVPQVPYVVDVTLLALAGVVIWLGWAVRAYQRGDRPSLSALRAARTLVLAKAAALAGAFLMGYYGAHVLVVLGNLDIPTQRDKAWAAGIAVVCAVVLAIAGIVAENWCRLPPPSDGETVAHHGEGEEEVDGAPG